MTHLTNLFQLFRAWVAGQTQWKNWDKPNIEHGFKPLLSLVGQCFRSFHLQKNQCLENEITFEPVWKKRPVFCGPGRPSQATGCMRTLHLRVWLRQLLHPSWYSEPLPDPLSFWLMMENSPHPRPFLLWVTWIIIIQLSHDAFQYMLLVLHLTFPRIPFISIYFQKPLPTSALGFQEPNLPMNNWSVWARNTPPSGIIGRWDILQQFWGLPLGDRL